MWALAIVVAEVDRQRPGPQARGPVGPHVGPLAQQGLDEALGLTVGAGPVGPSVDGGSSAASRRARSTPTGNRSHCRSALRVLGCPCAGTTPRHELGVKSRHVVHPGGRPSWAAIRAPVMRLWRRSRISCSDSAGVARGIRCGRELRSTSPAGPSSRTRRSHLNALRQLGARAGDQIVPRV